MLGRSREVGVGCIVLSVGVRAAYDTREIFFCIIVYSCGT